ncbi:TPA: hypothetical protein ACGOYL_001947, partial [Streptococcus suis]
TPYNLIIIFWCFCEIYEINDLFKNNLLKYKSIIYLSMGYFKKLAIFRTKILSFLKDLLYLWRFIFSFSAMLV